MNLFAHRPALRNVSILAALTLHAGLFLWAFTLQLSPMEKRDILEAVDAPHLLSFPRAVIDRKGIHWLSILLWDGNREVDHYWGLVRLCLDGDTRFWSENERYRRYIRHEASRPLPYRDVVVEYQPFGLAGLLVPALAADTKDAYHIWLAAWLGGLYLLNLGIALFLAAGGRPRPEQVHRALWVSITFLVLFGDIAAARFDHLVATAMLVAVLLFAGAMNAEGRSARLRFLVFGFVVAAGVLTKVVPGLVLPAGLIVLRVRQGRFFPGTGSALLGFAGGMILLNGLFFGIFGPGYAQSFTYHMERGIQLESVYAGVLMLAHLGGLPLSVSYSHMSLNLVTPLTGAIQGISLLAMAGLTAGIAWRVHRTGSGLSGGLRPAPPGWRLALVTNLLLLAFVLTNKVFSPQYLLWMAPIMLAAFAVRADMRLAGRLFLLAVLLTQLVFPILWDLVVALDPAAALVLNLRNAVLIGLLGLLLARLPGLMAPPRDSRFS